MARKHSFLIGVVSDGRLAREREAEGNDGSEETKKEERNLTDEKVLGVALAD